MPMDEYDALQDVNDSIILAHKLAMGRPVTRDDIEKFIARIKRAEDHTEDTMYRAFFAAMREKYTIYLNEGKYDYA